MNKARIDEALAILSEELDADVMLNDGGEKVVMVYPHAHWTVRLMPREKKAFADPSQDTTARPLAEAAADAVHAPDPPMGPKGPTMAAVEEAIRCIKKSQKWLVGALGEITGGLDLDECQNWLRETRLYVQEAERAIQYARDLRGHRQAPASATVVQEWGPEPGQRPVPADEERASAESKAERDAYDRALSQSARAGHPDPHGAALVVLPAGAGQ